MAAGKAPPRAAILALIIAAAPPIAAAAPSAIAAAGPASGFLPAPRRLEILQPWEKRAGAKPPELVAGIYELDYERRSFAEGLAITIDDAGPNKYLAKTLDILRKRGVKAVFFIIGSNFLGKDGRPMPRAKELLDRIVDEGHEIGSHSFWHRRLDEKPYRDDAAALKAELDRNEAAVDRVLGYHYPMIYFRPPNGAHSTPGYELDRMLRERGQYLTNWTITSFDWCMRLKAGDPDRLEPEAVLARTVKQAREESGGVVLLHCFPSTVAILDSILEKLAAARGEGGALSFTTLGELLRRKYASLKAGD
jgi:peptidoglycan/xylan/chitin deacetylase (PgdA/CDA1 family)